MKLSLVYLLDAEKDPALHAHTIGALCAWERPETLADVQLVFLCQHPANRAAAALAATLPPALAVDVVHARHDLVADYPVWDVCAELRHVWPLLRGEYIICSHAEFTWAPGALGRTLAWLAAERPYLALGNLRRFGQRDDAREWHTHRGTKEHSDQFTAMLSAGDFTAAAELLPTLPNLHWVYWGPEPRDNEQGWKEDVFAVDKDFATAARLFDHGGALPFQDVYDTTHQFIYRAGKHKADPRVIRAPRSVWTQYHLWHRKQWLSFTAAMRDYFLGHPEQWRDTAFLRRDLWPLLIDVAHQEVSTSERPVIALRQGPGGTVTRYAVACSQWLREGGADALADFYALHGRERRTC